jgi:hypothetical protein
MITVKPSSDLISFDRAIVLMGQADVMMPQSQIPAGTELSA